MTGFLFFSEEAEDAADMAEDEMIDLRVDLVSADREYKFGSTDLKLEISN